MEAFALAATKGILTEKDVSPEILKGFLGLHGRRFYEEPLSNERIVLTQGTAKVSTSLKHPSGNPEVVPFRRNEHVLNLAWL